jgi:hypothetical protein
MRKLKGTCEVVPVNTTKACQRSTGTPPLILNLRARWRLVVNITPRPLNPPKRTLVPNEWKAGWASRVAPIAMRTSDRPACSIVSTPTTLSRLVNERTEKTTRKFDTFTDEQTQDNVTVCTWYSFGSCVYSNYPSGPFWTTMTCSPQDAVHKTGLLPKCRSSHQSVFTRLNTTSDSLCEAELDNFV